MTNRKFYMRLFGDTSYVVHYLRWLGYDLNGVRQTGSNFGEEVKHETPVPQRGRQRDDGCRRAVHHQRRLLAHLLPSVASGHRSRELPRQPDRLSPRGQDG